MSRRARALLAVGLVALGTVLMQPALMALQLARVDGSLLSGGCGY